MIGDVGLKVSQQDIQSPFLANRIIAASIKKLVQEDDSKESAQLRQFQFLDDDREMMKRSYDTEQFRDRIGILAQISRPDTKFHIIQPVIVKNPFRAIMLKRTKRIKKYERKLQQIQEEVPVTFESKFLDTIDSTSTVRDISYDSSCHNIFTDCLIQEADGILKMAKTCVRGVSVLGQTNNLIFAETPKDLTFDFDDVDEDETLVKYKKLQNKQGFKKKHPSLHQQTRPSHTRKRLQQTTKALNDHLKPETDGIFSKKFEQLSPKLYNYTRRQQKQSVKINGFIGLNNQSIQTQNDSKKNIYKPSTLIEVNHNRSPTNNNIPTSIRVPTCNTTQFKAIRKRALELLADQTLNSPKVAKAKSPSFTTQRFRK